MRTESFVDEIHMFKRELLKRTPSSKRYTTALHDALARKLAEYRNANQSDSDSDDDEWSA